ncbi:MAG TPA: endopeptidase La, partial [Clostridiales bacterium]|nr:endopeptidase La [Clostridiales bacterium]
RLKSFNNNSTEAAVERKYIELLLELPWDKLSPESDDLEFAQNVLEEDHYGLKEVKERIIEFLSVRILTKAGDTPIICLVGPPGTGKTSIAKSIARALNKEYVKISLGGVRDEAEIRGHRRTYVAALPGIIVQGIKNAGVKNPLFLLDEIDKVGSDSRGDVSSALLEVLDSEQNNKFVDHFVEMPVDLSEVLFICTANSIRNIQKPLLDRLEVIEVPSYTENEKFHIGKDFLYKKQLKNNGLKKSQLTISDTAIVKVIAGYTREAGVRQLERNFGKLCRKAAKAIVIDDKDKVRISINNLSDYLGKERFTYEQANKKDQIGIVRGLAWTSMGGDTLEIEVNIMPGKGKFRVTGQIGGVMKESAQAGISYIRSVSKKYNIDSTYFDKYDIHIHIPQGAVPKDGPSAGVSMTTAILSAIIGRKVKADLAMTGEVTIRGRVLKVGGLKEKLLAAKMAKISTVLVPKDNERDIEEIDTEIKDGIHIKYIKDMDEVINYSILTKE